MDPVAFVVLISFVCLVAFIILFNSFFTEKKNSKISENIDASRRHFYYLLETNKELSLEKLTVKGINDTIDYHFDPASSIMAFTYNDMKYSLKLRFYNIQSYTYMVATSDNPIIVNSLPAFINSFFEKKLNSTPVEVFYFEGLLKNNNIDLS